MEKYFYLLWASIFLGFWMILFLRRKDTRKEMLTISALFGLGGLAAQKTNIQDWWQPLTITGTSIGIEDFLIGFSIGGIAAVIYEEIYRRRLRKGVGGTLAPSDPGFFLLLFPLLYLILFFLLELGSFYSVVVACLASIGFMLFSRRDLWRDSLMSGVIMLAIGSGVYFLLFLIKPDYIQQFWYLPDHWYAQLLFGVPIGEYIWFFLIGAYIGPLYEYLKRLRLVRERKQK